MTVLEEEGRTPEEAVEEGLRKLALSREYVLVETLDEGTRGFLGMGGRQARVRFTVTPAGERILKGRDALEGLLNRMGVQAVVKTHELQGRLHLEITGGDAGLLIGKYGQTLESLNFLVSRILGRLLGERAQVEIDVEGYRERRRQLLERRALRLAEQVKVTGEPVTLEPMSSLDRRTIHLALQRDSHVRTESLGEGPLRRLIITPAARRV